MAKNFFSSTGKPVGTTQGELVLLTANLHPSRMIENLFYKM